jgi:hypothetical protein
MTDEQDAERLKKECIDRINAFRNTLWETYYPPAIHQLKPSGYDDDGTYLTSGIFFDLYQESDTSEKSWLTILDLSMRQVQLNVDGGEIRAFRFVAAEGKALGPLEAHAYWTDSQGDTQLRLYADPRPLDHIIAYTTSKMTKTYPILFKMIPLAVNDGSTTRRPVKLIPYREDSKLPTPADEHDTFGTVWRVEQTSSPQ